MGDKETWLGTVVSEFQDKESFLSVEGRMMKRREVGSSVAGYADGEQDCLSYKEQQEDTSGSELRCSSHK